MIVAMKIDNATIVRTIILFLSVINIVLERHGIKALPIDNDLISEAVSVGFLLYGVISSWWHNNSFTKEAQKADEYLKKLKNLKKQKDDK
jgi:SPP1 family holin